MQVIAILGCIDTKKSELDYAAAEFAKRGLKPLTIDVSTSAGFRSDADFTNLDVSREVGVDWQEIEGGNQHELLDIMAQGARALVVKLYGRGEIQGIFSCGGLQNTTIAAQAMRALPIGVPKFILSTVASGQRTFDSIVGAKDIVTMPSISDFAGLNVVSRTVLDNAVAAVAGMIEHAGREIPRPASTLIGATLMGATNDGVVKAIRYLQDAGYDVVSFHSTGAGGRSFEQLIGSSVISAAMDLTLHEIVYEHFGRGFGFGPKNRLMAAIERKIPLLVCPAGIDFICQWRNELFEDASTRLIHWHNKDLAHVRLNEQEITDISRIVVGRLNEADAANVKVLIPTQGFRSFTRKGEALHDPRLDKLIIDIMTTKLRADIPVRLLDCNFMDREFYVTAAQEMISLIRGQVPDA